MRAKRAGVETVMEPDSLDRLGSNKRDARKIVRAHDFFLADASLMSSVGRSLGPFLGTQRQNAHTFTLRSSNREHCIEVEIINKDSLKKSIKHVNQDRR